MLELADWQWIRPYSIIYLLFVSAATTFLNGFTLFVIFKDPLKCFRDPLKTHFIETFKTNVMIGLVEEPLIAFFHIRATSFDVHVPWIFADGLGLMVLSIAAAQLLPIDTMELYQPLVAKRLSMAYLASIGMDFLIFPLVVTNGRAFTYLDTFPYGAVYLIILIIILIANCKSFLGRAGLQAASPNDEFFKGTIIITLFLIITILSFLVHTIIHINRAMNGDHISSLDGLILSYIMLLKFLLDPLVFIFRVPKYYRRAVRIVCVECGHEHDDDTRSVGLPQSV